MGEEFTDPNSLERILIQDTFLRERSMQNRIGVAAFSILDCVKPLFTEQVYLSGLENLFQNRDINGEGIPGPFLWTMKHESYYDVVNYPPEFRKVPRTPKYVVMGRNNYLPVPGLNYLFLKLFNMISIKRGWLEGEMNPKKKKEIDDFNKKAIKRFWEEIRKGCHPFVLPEGTTLNNGEIQKVRSGSYNMSHLIEDGKLYVVNCVPVGNTYDLMSGSLGRHIVFLNVGEMFQYQPAAYHGEKPEDYVKKDIAQFSDTIRQSFADLNTVTLPQILGLMLRDYARRGIRYVSYSEMHQKAFATVMELRARADKDPVHIDPALFTNPGMYKRMNKFYSSLMRKGYLFRDMKRDRINEEQILRTCEPERFKKENPLGYMTNRILSVLEERPSMRVSFEHGLGIENLEVYKPLRRI